MKIKSPWALLLVIFILWSQPALSAKDFPESPNLQKAQIFLKEWYQHWDQTPKPISKLSHMVALKNIDLKFPNNPIYSRSQFKKTLKAINKSSNSSFSDHILKYTTQIGPNAVRAIVGYRRVEMETLITELEFSIDIEFTSLEHKKLQIVSYKPKLLNKKIVGGRTAWKIGY